MQIRETYKIEFSEKLNSFDENYFFHEIDKKLLKKIFLSQNILLIFKSFLKIDYSNFFLNLKKIKFLVSVKI